MMARKPFTLLYDPEAARHVESIGRRGSGVIRRTIEERLTWEPEVVAIHRKPLQEPSSLGLAWELRFGPRNRFRVFYRVDARAREVRILAAGEKRGNSLRIGGQEFEL